MEQDNGKTVPKPQLLFLGQKSTERLLEVYVKRSLSLHDVGSRQRRVKPRKWIIVGSKGSRIRKASSDSSTQRLSREISQTDRSDESGAERSTPSKQQIRKQTTKGGHECKVTKKPSILRSFLRLFTRKNDDVQGSSQQDSSVFSGPSDPSLEDQLPTAIPQGPREDGESSALRPAKSIKKRLSLKKLSFRSRDTDKTGSLKRSTSPCAGDVVRVPDAVVCVEPSSVYFEKVSEELERIVKEVKDSPSDDEPHCAAAVPPVPDQAALKEDSSDDILERMVFLLKQQGDEIDEKIRRNSTVSAFFQRLTYRNFQQLADLYVAEIPSPLPETTAAPPQLVKLAFTLDLTAKVAGLSSQAVGRVMGFGNQYIQDRFTQITRANSMVFEGQNVEESTMVDQD